MSKLLIWQTEAGKLRCGTMHHLSGPSLLGTPATHRHYCVPQIHIEEDPIQSSIISTQARKHLGEDRKVFNRDKA